MPLSRFARAAAASGPEPASTLRGSTPRWLVLAAIAAFPGAAAAAESYDNCTGYIDTLPAVLSSPGYYCLRADLATPVATGNAITINSDDVTVDCNDFKVGNLAAGSGTQARGIGSDGFYSDIAVRRCNVRGFAYGIFMYSSNTLVEDNLFDGSRQGGVGLQGKRNRVRRNQVTDTGLSTYDPDGSPVAIWVGSESDVADNVIVGVHTTGAGEPIAIRAWDSWQPNMVLGTISGNRISNLTRASGDRFHAIHVGPGRAVISDNHLTAADAFVDAGAVYCNTSVGSGNGVVRDNTFAGYVAPAIAICADGGGNVSF
jgi:hypothetical protein